MSTAERYAVEEQAHGWRWTYTGISAGDAEEIAGSLSGRGESWTARRIEPAAVTVRAGDLVPGDIYANEDGSPVADDLASHGGVHVGVLPRPWVRFVPLMVVRVAPSDHPAWPAPHWVYVEASNGRGATVPADGKTRIVAREAPCVICGEPTTNTQRASIGNRSGVACEDCAYWCDGNLEHVSGQAGEPASGKGIAP